jgi:hypothetical protein
MYSSQKTPGKKFGSAFAGRRYDEAHSEDGLHELGKESPEHEAKETPEFEAGEQEGKQENQHEEEGETHPVAAEHGPAHKVVISHDEEANQHTVVSHHKDGHMHKSSHDAAHKAHQEAKRLANVKDEQDMEEKPAEHSSEQGESDGFSMPSLD